MSVEIEGRWSHEDHCSAFEAELGRFAGVVENADPAAKVPTCPGWTIAKLLKHVGITHRWAEHLVRHPVHEPLPTRDVPVTLPDDDTGYPGWLAAGGASLVRTLREADGDTPVWAWGIDQHVRFWSRRMLHEGTVHRADVEIALGREPAIDSRVATDGVDELLGNLSVATWVAASLKELGGDGEVLHFHATDTADGEWMVTLGPEGFSARHGHGKGDVAVRGTASDLLLLLYGRLAPEGGRFEVFGDRELLGRWLEKTAL
ncbi:maleylpyruvate isomerase family mycothiol-dependent enzyme [Sphaerisporangium sp. NPDC049002]|uniref:maleylpyruvate isomerase family mycothiol-dependent enzyme n=1 Tax=unclassified Sphaerisporangium TaxID=2630420 RepID=UPI0033FBD919